MDRPSTFSNDRMLKPNQSHDSESTLIVISNNLAKSMDYLRLNADDEWNKFMSTVG